MVEPLFRFEGFAEVGSKVTLDGPEGHHAAAVRRIRVGESVQLTDGVKVHIRGEVVSVSAKTIDIEVRERIQLESPSLRFTLVQALAKGDRDELAIQAATELGVSSVIPWQADRSVSKWDATKAIKNRIRWQTICDEASKQALRPLFVEVAAVRTSKDLCMQIESLSSGDSSTLWLVLDPTARESISSVNLSDVQDLHLVVGPEGGISEPELPPLKRPAPSEFTWVQASYEHQLLGLQHWLI